MSDNKVYTAIGLMSGTSLDGVDIALIETDGDKMVKRLDFATYPYTEQARFAIRACLGKRQADDTVTQAENLIHKFHCRAIEQFGHKADVIGFHGQTITHDPANRFTWQIGDAQRLADEAGMDVVGGMRLADVAAGGQGAPLLPLYHRALAALHRKPVAIANIGGVSNVTWLGENDDILAFDCGPGNAMIDDFISRRTASAYDEGGIIAASGTVDQDIVSAWLNHAYFRKAPPKSLDRNDFDVSSVESLSTEDGAATLTEFTVRSIAVAQDWFKQPPYRWYITGGGRHNKFMMETLKKFLGPLVDPIERAGWNGDAMEAEGFAYLAVRSLKGLPLSLPTTTGVPTPMPGGTLYKAQRR